jgi:hypothetical protein
MPAETAPVASVAADATPPAPPPPPPPERYLVTVHAVSVDPRRPDGSPWDDGATEPKPTPLPAEPMASYLKRHPELIETVAVLGDPALDPEVARNARKTPGADPIVFIGIGDEIFRSPVMPGVGDTHLSGFTIVTPPLAADAIFAVTVVDRDGPDVFEVLGTTTAPLTQMTAGAIIELPRFGAVASLTFKVKPVAAEPNAPPRVTKLAIPGKPTWTDSGIDLVAGQDVLIEAAGEVCTKGDSRVHCGGPEGQAKPAESNLPGFATRGHGGLIAAIGDVRFAVGRELHFSAPVSGRLYLGINDKDDGNNQGRFDVRVTVR